MKLHQTIVQNYVKEFEQITLPICPNPTIPIRLVFILLLQDRDLYADIIKSLQKQKRHLKPQKFYKKQDESTKHQDTTRINPSRPFHFRKLY